MNPDYDNPPLSVLQNLVYSLVGSLIYVIAVVIYVAYTFKLTIYANQNVVFIFWGVIIWICFTILELSDKRTPKDHVKWLFK